MSAYYGPTPVQSMGLKQYMWRKLENFKYDPSLEGSAPLTYFNNSKSSVPVNMYDCLFNQPEGWDQRRPRCDRRLVSHIHPEIYDEVIESSGDTNFYTEKAKMVPVLWSLWYGRPTLPAIDPPGKEFARRPQITSFYRRFGLNLETELEQKPN